PSSRSSASASASAPSTTPSSTAATTSASFARRPSSTTIESTACASARATSCASPEILGMRLLAEQGVQLVLEPAALDRAVDPALLRRVRLPPPAAGPRRLVGRDRTCARRPADRLVALVLERVVGHLALAHVVPHLVLGPLGEWIQLDHGAVV